MDRATDRWAVLTLAARLAQAIDDRDEAAYRACLAGIVFAGDPGDVRPVSADLYARDAIGRVAPLDWTHHQLSNPVIEIGDDGEHAAALIDVVVTMARTDSSGLCRRMTIGGRYDLGFVRFDGDWRIERRTMVRRYADGDPAIFES